MWLTKLNNSDTRWALLGAEAVLIVISVLLALGLEGWREERERQALANRAVEGFVDEVRANCENIQATDQYHQSVVEGSRSPEGMRVGLLRNDAWEVVKTTGATGSLDYELVAVMAEISARQRDHRDVIQSYLEAVFALILTSKDASTWHREGERAVISELVRIQKDLRTRYRNLAELASERVNNPTLAHDACMAAALGDSVADSETINQHNTD